MTVFMCAVSMNMVVIRSADHKSTAETGTELMRPYLHEFLAQAYENYDIVIWCKSSIMNNLKVSVQIHCKNLVIIILEWFIVFHSCHKYEMDKG